MFKKLIGRFSKSSSTQTEAFGDEHEVEPVVFHEGDDPEVSAANKKAKETFKYFWREVSWERRRILPGLDLACVKFPFSDDESSPVEHMWVDEVDFDGDQVSGTLLNSPNWLTSVSAGDRVSKPLSEVGDWMFAISGRVFGAFTVNLLRSRMSPAERQDHDEAWDLDFGDPTEISLVHSTGDQSEEAALHDHPMALNCEENIRKQIQENPEIIHECDERGWTVLHHEALAGNRNIVGALLEAGADPGLRTSSGFSAADLAAVLGWEETIATFKAHEE